MWAPQGQAHGGPDLSIVHAAGVGDIHGLRKRLDLAGQLEDQEVVKGRLPVWGAAFELRD